MSYDVPDLTLGTRDFSPGYLDSPESDTLDPGASPDARNCFFGSVELHGKRRATLRRAPGSRLVTPSAVVASTGCDGLIPYTREAGTSQLLGKWGGAWYRYDEIDSFTAISGATGYVAGNPGRAVLFKNQAFLHDGSKQQLWDGATVRDVGFVKPTGVTAMTAGTGPGVTGTYSARYTWYDQTHDHESSPSTDATASLVLTNQTRTHTAPTGSPPSNVTHYRIYVRREDTSEAYWMRVATVIYGVPTYTEAVTDGTRVDPLPLNSANDPPTVNFAAMGVWKGFVVGFVEDGSDMHVSKQHDCESWNPKDIFKVSPGDGKGVRAVVSFGTYCVIMKPTRSFYLEGSRLPFEIRELSPDYGTVSVEATIAVGDYLYAWDEVKGPYRTNLNVWEGLADYRIDATLERVTNTRQIRVAHDEAHSLIVWSIGTEYVGRNRTLLAYHYGLETWLPPITGLEYGALTHYTPNNAASGLFCGDLWGRVHRLFETDRQSVPSGTVMTSVAALPTPPSTTQITGDSAAFYTTGAGLAGLPVAIQQADGSWVWHRIASNTATVLTLDTTYHPPLAATPAVGARIFVGGIDWYWWSPVLDGGAPGVRKRAGWFDLQWKPAGDETTTILPSHTIQVVLRFDEGEGPITSRTADFSAATGASLWNSAIWGTSVWSTVVRRQRKVRVGRAFRAVQVGFSNYEPDQATEITGYSIGCDWLRRRKALSASA